MSDIPPAKKEHVNDDLVKRLIKEFNIRPKFVGDFRRHVEIAGLTLLSRFSYIVSGNQLLYERKQKERRRLKEFLDVHKFESRISTYGEIGIKITLKPAKGRAHSIVTGDTVLEHKIFEYLTEVCREPLPKKTPRGESFSTQILACFQPLAKFLLDNKVITDSNGKVSMNRIAKLVEAILEESEIVKKTSLQNITKHIFPKNK